MGGILESTIYQWVNEFSLALNGKAVTVVPRIFRFLDFSDRGVFI
jgi:hypothetical protein